MFAYYLDLALRSLKHHKALTALMVLALALGIGACITTLTVLRLLSGDPLPQQSAQLYYPQLDPRPLAGYVAGETKPADTLSYVDAMNLLHAHKAEREVVTALARAKISPSHAGQRPFFSDGVMTTADFFPMFDVPFQYGSGWSAADADDHARVAVIAGFLNDKLFAGGNSVGQVIRVNEHDYRIIGVLKPWAPQPRFYAHMLGGRDYGDGDAVFLPLQSARADGMDPGSINCYAMGDVSKLETAPCMWLGMWVELRDASAAAAYKSFLANYVQQQIGLGRLQRPEVALPALLPWLRAMQIVPDDVRLQAGLALGFLLICVVNTVGLLLAKCLRRSREIGVRRALGASRRAIFAQFMVEAGMIGLAGGVLGLLLAELGLWAIRQQPAQYASLAHLDAQMFLATFVVALVASLVAGMLPAWRACVVAPAPQLKAA
ncbi:MAG TPA: ABC transporter permease [Rhodanobacter sp.]|nr:ABC transporter permease [Rhodanobacter sp.]